LPLAPSLPKDLTILSAILRGFVLYSPAINTRDRNPIPKSGPSLADQTDQIPISTSRIGSCYTVDEVESELPGSLRPGIDFREDMFDS
jgi:hypothetical protein